MLCTNDFPCGCEQIPEGFQIFQDRVAIAGMLHYKDAAILFAERHVEYGIGWVEFERDLSNSYDPNAIKIMGCNKTRSGHQRNLLGYMPKEVSEVLVERGYLEYVIPRLTNAYVSESGYIEILFQILGPKEKIYEFRQCFFKTRLVEPGQHYSCYVDQVKFFDQHKDYEKAIELLLQLIAVIESEAKESGRPVATWYYEKLAIIYRKLRRYEDEVAILERYEKQPGRV